VTIHEFPAHAILSFGTSGSLSSDTPHALP
jgi:hypothetical protein